MPLMNKNYVTPAWIDNAAPPINDDELNAMSKTLEGSQILVGNGAPTSSTPGKVGQRYADISTTPATMYVASAGFPGQPIPKLQTQEEVRDAGYLIAYDSNSEFKSGSNDASDVTVLVYDVTRSGDDTVFYVLFTCKAQGAIAYLSSASTTQVYFFDTYYLNVRDNDTGLYYASQGLAFRSPDAVIEAPTYPNRAAALQAAANPPAVWKPEADPNRNTAREYSTGSSYAAGDYCIHDGKLWRALEAAGGAWDGSKWEQAKYADDLSGHEADQNNPHNVTAAQTGAVSPPVLATVQATTAAVRDYFAGEYFFYEGQLYEVKEAVAQGGDLFAWGTPPDVTVYDMDVYYDSSEYSSTSPEAVAVASGISMKEYMLNIYSQKVLTSSRYFYWNNGSSIRQIRYSEDEYEIDGAVYEVVLRGLSKRPKLLPQYDGQSGNVYYTYSDPPSSLPTIGYVWPDNAKMFSGTSAQLEEFIGQMPSYKKSEPAVLGNGVTALRQKTGTVTIGTFWSGSGPYSQTVTVTGTAVTTKSKVDLTPTAAQLASLAEDGVLSLTIENNGGTLTAWVVGTQPSAAMTISCVVRETA